MARDPMGWGLAGHHAACEMTRRVALRRSTVRDSANINPTSYASPSILTHVDVQRLVYLTVSASIPIVGINAFRSERSIQVSHSFALEIPRRMLFSRTPSVDASTVLARGSLNRIDTGVVVARCHLRRVPTRVRATSTWWPRQLLEEVEAPRPECQLAVVAADLLGPPQNGSDSDDAVHEPPWSHVQWRRTNGTRLPIPGNMSPRRGSRFRSPDR